MFRPTWRPLSGLQMLAIGDNTRCRVVWLDVEISSPLYKTLCKHVCSKVLAGRYRSYSGWLVRRGMCGGRGCSVALCGGHCSYVLLASLRHSTEVFGVSIVRLKRDGTRAETRFRLSRKRTSPFKLAGASVQSTAGSRGVRIGVSKAGYTTFRGSMRVLATHSIRQFPLLMRHCVPPGFKRTLPTLTSTHQIQCTSLHPISLTTSPIYIQKSQVTSP